MTRNSSGSRAHDVRMKLRRDQVVAARTNTGDVEVFRVKQFPQRPVEDWLSWGRKNAEHVATLAAGTSCWFVELSGKWVSGVVSRELDALAELVGEGIVPFDWRYHRDDRFVVQIRTHPDDWSTVTHVGDSPYGLTRQQAEDRVRQYDPAGKGLSRIVTANVTVDVQGARFADHDEIGRS